MINPFEQKTFVALLSAAQSSFQDDKTGKTVNLKKATFWDFNRGEFWIGVNLPPEKDVSEYPIGTIYEVKADAKSSVSGSSVSSRVVSVSEMVPVGEISIAQKKK